MATRAEQGDTVGLYVLEAYLGSGGFAEVWRARHVETGALVAIKLLTRAALDADAINLRAEIELLAGAAAQNTEHLVRVLDGGTTPVPFVVMELVRGSDLASELRRGGRLSQRETVRVGLAVAEALVALHGAGIIHRDVKPANVLLDATGTIKLADFGIAKIVGYDSLTMTGQGPFSPYYAAPEAWEGRATMQSDLYSLGAMLHECLVGTPPFAGSLVELLVAHRERLPDMDRLPPETVPTLRALIHDCMEKDAAQRPASAAACLAILREVQAQVEPSAAVHRMREPAALGPWVIEGPAAGQAWAFRCTHPDGHRAVVEVHAGDDLALGDRLRAAVEANGALEPLGAARLLGTNRLILRPGEGWPDQPPGRFLFWVAQAPPEPVPPPAAWNESLLATVAAGLGRLEEAGTAQGLALDFREARVRTDGSVWLGRPGLPPRAGTPLDALGFLRSLALPSSLAAVVATAPDVRALQPGAPAVAGGETMPPPPPPQAGASPPTSIVAPSEQAPPPPLAPPVAQAAEQTELAGRSWDPQPGAARPGLLAPASTGRRLGAGAIDALVPVIMFFAVAGTLLEVFNQPPDAAQAHVVASAGPPVAALPVWIAPFAFVDEPSDETYPYVSDGENAFSIVAAWAAAGLGFFLYSMWMESSRGRATLGKRWLGLHLAMPDGSPPTPAAVRSRAIRKTLLMTLTVGLGAFAFASARDGQTFYDRATGIVVARR